MKNKRPNIIYIMSDDHAAHAIGAYGSYRNGTPNIDRIAEEGIRLDNCFCTNSICTPSRAAILTGKYAHKNGVLTFNALPSNQLTYPQILRNGGYYTAMIGKWHLDCEPTGFDDWNVLIGQGLYHDPEFVHNGVKTKYSGYVTDVITDLTLETIRSRPEGKPFCVLCHHKAPHDMWESDDKHAGMFAGETIREPPTLFDTYENRASAIRQSTQVIGRGSKVRGRMHPSHTLFEKETGHIDDPAQRRKAQYQEYIKRYLRCVASIDDNVGRVLDYLDESGLAEDTIIIYTSDQGFFLGEHGWYDKRFMYEESLRMPFLMRYPREIEPGSVDDHIIINTDFAPCFLDYAGLADETQGDMQGKSFRGILRGESPENWREIMYYRYYRSHFNTPSHWGVRTKDFKYIFYTLSFEHELFDLRKDTQEMKSVWDEPEYLEIGEHLTKETARLREELGDSDDRFAGETKAWKLLNEPGHPYY